MSKGEGRIQNILNNARIKYIKEKTFNDLRNGLLRYDFYIPAGQDYRQCCIEFDGEQHFSMIKAFYKNEREWKHAREHDRVKNSYCLAHDITLYRIPYWDFDKLETLEDLFKEQYIVKDRWHNDNLIDQKK